MSEAPEVIYLQWTGTEGHEDNTWCSDGINDDDVEYIKKQVVIDEILSLLERYEKHLTVCMYCYAKYHEDDCDLMVTLNKWRSG